MSQVQARPARLAPRLCRQSVAVHPVCNQVVYYRRLGERRGVAEGAEVVLGDLAQDAAHDLARTGLRQAGRPLDEVGGRASRRALRLHPFISPTGGRRVPVRKAAKPLPQNRIVKRTLAPTRGVAKPDHGRRRCAIAPSWKISAGCVDRPGRGSATLALRWQGRPLTPLDHPSGVSAMLVRVRSARGQPPVRAACA